MCPCNPKYILKHRVIQINETAAQLNLSVLLSVHISFLLMINMFFIYELEFKQNTKSFKNP